VLRSDRGELTHTNHYVAEDFCSVNEQTEMLGSTHHRYDRINALIDGGGHPLSVDELKSFFRDHDGYPGSICAHPDGRSSLKTVASLISEPAEGRLHAALGNPCGSEYVTYRF
jgi:isopenicillin-N N-acyltransferase-like protein